MSSQKNIAILCNPLAGNGKSSQVTSRISKELASRNMCFTVFDEKWPEQFENFTDVFIVGGDGTLNYFINHYPNISLPLVIFGGGTGNDFCWMLYGDITFDQQLETALTAEAKPVDIGRCNEKYFINGVGIGFDGEVSRSLTGKKKSIGKTAFLIEVLKKIFTYRSKTYKIISEEINLIDSKLMIAIANARRVGGGFHIAPESEVNDGFFDLVIIDPLSSLQRLRYLPIIEKGKHLQLPFIKYAKTKKVLIESNEPMQAHLDGEYCSWTKIEIEILPGKLFFRSQASS